MASQHDAGAAAVAVTQISTGERSIEPRCAGLSEVCRTYASDLRTEQMHQHLQCVLDMKPMHKAPLPMQAWHLIYAFACTDPHFLYGITPHFTDDNFLFPVCFRNNKFLFHDSCVNYMELHSVLPLGGSHNCFIQMER